MFTVGTDQIFRVDRLSLVNVLRAKLSTSGAIETNIGLNYGRLTKNLIGPSCAHHDAIITPTQTLAASNTHTSMYDQPPYEPEVVSINVQAAPSPDPLGYFDGRTTQEQVRIYEGGLLDTSLSTFQNGAVIANVNAIT